MPSFRRPPDEKYMQVRLTRTMMSVAISNDRSKKTLAIDALKCIVHQKSKTLPSTGISGSKNI